MTASIFGTGFQAGAQVSLTAAGQSNIMGTNATVVNSTTLTATFDLTSTAPGAYNVVVTEPGGAVMTLPNGFTVQQGGAPQIAMDIIGLDKIRFGQAQTYYLVVTNTGSVDSAPGLLSLSVPASLQYTQMSGPNLFVAGSTPDPEFGIPGPGSTTTANQNLLFATAAVPAGQTQAAPVQLTLPSDPSPPDPTITVG